MKFTVPFEVLVQPEFKSMSVHARLLYFYLARYKSQGMDIDFPKWVSVLMQETGFTVNTFNKAEKELVKKGFIKITKEIEQIETEKYSFADSKGKRFNLSLI